jgi:hypothetical protein
MKNTPKPFKDFNPEKSVKLLELAESICRDEFDAAEHLAVSFMSLCPNLDIATTMIKTVDIVANRSN